MSVIGSNIIAGASGTVETGYQISRSLRFNSADSANLSRTPASAGNRQKWTWSGWVKRSKLGTQQPLLAVDDGTYYCNINFNTSDQLVVQQADAAWANNYGVITNGVYRDVGAWMHVVVAMDTTQATAANRTLIYVNGSLASVSAGSGGGGTYITQNYNTYVNSTIIHRIGGWPRISFYTDNYIADVLLIDGQALDPTSFGQTDSATGVWVPKAYTGTYGTNGFWLKFDDNSGTTSTTLGKDSSGNSNNWTPNNFSVTAGVGNDSLVDSPTNYGTDTGVGGEVRGNYATLNPISTLSTVTLANGNLDYSSTTASRTAIATIGVTTGKWYWEVVTTAGTTETQVGVYGTAASALYSLAANSTVYGIRFDADAGTLDRTSDGTTWTSIATGLTSGPYFPYFNNNGTTAKTVSVNFGQRPFAYTAPSGFKALCTQNLPTPTIGTSSTNLADDYFNVVTYTGTGSSLSVTGVGFQPDLVWIKGRSGATDHALYDAVRGVQKQLESNTTTDETTESTGLTAFGTDGFTVGALAQLNTSAATYVGWNWKESATSGFDIVTYTGNGANRTIAHNLGVAPNMLIVKARTTAGTDTGWPVWHTGIANTNYLELHATTASTSGTTYWNSTSPTSSVFSVGTAAAVNTNNDTYVAYLFAEVTGFSKIGTYTGNGSTDGPFVYCGFRPRFIMAKRTDTTGDWVMTDSARATYNVVDKRLFANVSDAESSTTTPYDFLSNGFKLRNTNANENASGGTYVYMAFAEFPFQYARAR